MKYVSTRGNGGEVSSAAAIKQGLAGDGGLFIPDSFPKFEAGELQTLCRDDYPTRAAKVLYKYLCDDYTLEELEEDCRAAYSEERFPGGAAPVVALGDKLRVLELWHGPTAAFKDMALQIMPRLLSRALVKTGEKRTAFILVATSGDTGKAALEGYRDIDGVKIMVFYPVDGVSRVQKLQMASQEGSNVSVHSVVGNFDDTQNGVKAIFSDPEARAELDKKGLFLSSANSINWGRLAPQIVYYVSAYCDMVNSGDIKLGEEINVCVPTGNFGNILAAYIAKMMGLPIHRFVCASNMNNVLTDFFADGTYDRNRAFHTTTSPSMDILISSNLERLLYLCSGAKNTAELMRELTSDGKYTVSADVFEKLKSEFSGGYCDEEKTASVIKEMFDKYGYLCDTHTAVGVGCALRFMNEVDSEHKMLSVSTASPYKFAPAVYGALTGLSCENETDSIDALSRYTHTEVPGPLAGIAKRKIRFDPSDSIKADEMKKTVLG